VDDIRKRPSDSHAETLSKMTLDQDDMEEFLSIKVEDPSGNSVDECPFNIINDNPVTTDFTAATSAVWSAEHTMINLTTPWIQAIPTPMTGAMQSPWYSPWSMAHPSAFGTPVTPYMGLSLSPFMPGMGTSLPPEVDNVPVFGIEEILQEVIGESSKTFVDRLDSIDLGSDDALPTQPSKIEDVKPLPDQKHWERFTDAEGKYRFKCPYPQCKHCILNLI
jgi:hypothetical protein